MISYPQTPDPADYGVVVSAATGNVANARHAAHAVYDLAGYALGQLYADNMQAGPPDPNFDPQKYCETMASGGKHAGKVNWGALIQFLIKLLPVLIPMIQPSPVVTP